MLQVRKDFRRRAHARFLCKEGPNKRQFSAIRCPLEQAEPTKRRATPQAAVNRNSLIIILTQDLLL